PWSRTPGAVPDVAQRPGLVGRRHGKSPVDGRELSKQCAFYDECPRYHHEYVGENHGGRSRRQTLLFDKYAAASGKNGAYFGDTFFNTAMRGTANLRVALRWRGALVHKRELRKGFPPSPQIAGTEYRATVKRKARPMSARISEATPAPPRRSRTGSCRPRPHRTCARNQACHWRRFGKPKGPRKAT